jgi:WD40 repeat protein/tRNA A-37 threonylcarbamoyl transferase component Bud32
MAADLLDPAPNEVDDLIAVYLDALDHGRAPARQAWLALHAAHADELGKFLDDLESLSPGHHPATSSPEDTLSYYAGPSPADAFPVRLFQPGQVFGDYELIDAVARGGMGVVFKARHQKLDRVVALKMILAGHFAFAQDVERFHTEAQAAARLNHPGIVPVYEVGEVQGLHYFTMAFVDGESLAGRLRAGPLELRQAASLVRDLADAIQFAHDSGVVHRDIKPGNVLIDKNGQPRLTDFGLAKRTDRDSEVTGTGQILGTPSYMAPEQTAGDPAAVGPAADVYGLGALLFASLTGRPPFQAATPLETIRQVVASDPPRPSVVNPAVPRDLETICLKCLEKSPGKRYESATALRDDLDRFLGDQPIRARRVGAIEKVYRWVRRRPVVGAMTVALALLLVAVPLLLAGMLAEEVNARKKVQAAEQARTRQLFDALVNEAAARRTSPRVGHRFVTLDRIAAARDLADELKLPADDYTRLRSEAVGALSLVDLKNSADVPGWMVRRNPEDCRYVSATDNFLEWDLPNGLLVRRAADKRIVHRIPVESANGSEAQARISADNHFVSYQLKDKLVVWQIDGDQPVERLRRNSVILALFTPDRPEVMVFTATDDLMAESLTGGPASASVNLIKLTGEKRTIHRWKFAAGPRHLAATAGQKCVRIVDLDAGRVIATFDVAESIQHINWSPDGSTVVVSSGVFGLNTVFHVPTGVRRTFQANVGGPELSAFSPSGRFLLVANGWNGRNALADISTGDIDLRFDLAELQGNVAPGRPAGWWQETTDNIHRVLTLAPEDGLGGGGESAVHPGGRLLASPAGRGLALHDLATGQRLGFLWTGKRCAHPRFDSAGNLFASSFSSSDRHPVRWPVTAEGNRLRIGPSESIDLARGICIDVSSDGRFVVQAAYNNGSAVLDRQTGRITHLQPQQSVSLVAIHPDGSLVASFGWDVGGLRLWNRANGKLVEVRDMEGQGGGRFTPDGRYLVTMSAGPHLQLWSIPACTPVRKLGPRGGYAISPDGRYLAVAETDGKVRITRIDDGTTVARFDAPGEEYIDHVTFSRDGRYLIGTKNDRVHQHVWDLWQMRRRLAEMKLDYEPEPAPEPIDPRESITVEIVKQ